MRRKRISNPKQDTLEFPELKKDWETHGIFSEHYIRNKLKTSSLWPKEDEIIPVWEFCKNLWDKLHVSLGKGDEELTKQEFLEPVLTKLGFAYLRGKKLPVGRMEPDYLLFEDETTKQKVLIYDTSVQYATATSVLEAKKVNHPLDAVSKRETPGRFPHQQIRDYLQEATNQSGNPYFRWAILTNGNKWRLYCRDSHPTHYFELNLEAIIASLEKFKVFVALFSPRVFIKNSEGRCPLDDIRDEAFRFQIALEDDLRKRVFVILTDMANGFYKRAENNISKDNLKELYENCLILLYRLLFVLYAEGRDLLPVKYGGSGSNMHYRERYSLQRLIPKLKNSLNFSSDEITELYEDILKLFHLINGDNPALNRKCDVPLYNGGLFDSKKYPLLERWILGEKTLANILKGFIFSNIPVEKGEQDRLSFSETIDYADLEIRHLGSIYEGLLENHLEHENNNIILKGDRAERKTTGTYYTPDYIVRYIIDNTLGPVCNEIEKSEEIRNSVAKKSRDDSFAKAALNLKILDPAMGSGHFLVRATEFLADKIFYHTTTKLKVERVLQGLSQEQAEIAYWRRKVVESCIFGVDLNPLAVELSKLSLWLTSIATDQPLSFLDHHLRPGNSLIGANLNALGWLHTRKERIQRSLFADLQKEVGQAIQTLHAIEVIETNDLTIIKEKETLWNKEVRDRLLPLRTIADLWTSSFFGTKINDTKYQNLARLIMSNPKPRTKEAMMLKREIGPYLNFYEVAKKMMFFHWELEFPDVFFNEDGSPKENPGFDAIIGNPPYINIENIPKVLREYFVIFYGENHKLGKRYDIYQLFVLKGLSLLKNFSYMGFILPNTFLMGHSYKIMMKIVTNMTKILECVDLPHGVFKEVTVDNVLLFLMRNPNDQERIKNMIVIKKLDPKSEISRILSNSWDEVFSIPQQILSKEYDYKLNIHSNPTQQKLFHLLESVSIQLGKITESSQGIILYKTAEDSARAEYTSKTPKEGWKRLLRGKNIGRYFIKYNGEFVHYGPWLWCPREEKYLNRAKILLQAMRNKSLFRRLVATYDNERYYNAHNLANIIKKEDSPYHLKYILGLVNSLLLNYWYKAHFPNVNINPNDFRQLPIRKINFNNSSEKKLHDDLVVLVDVMLDLNKKIQSAKGSAKDQIQRQIEKTDREIDEIVYKLYGITEEEKMIIEGIS